MYCVLTGAIMIFIMTLFVVTFRELLKMGGEQTNNKLFLMNGQLIKRIFIICIHCVYNHN